MLRPRPSHGRGPSMSTAAGDRSGRRAVSDGSSESDPAVEDGRGSLLARRSRRGALAARARGRGAGEPLFGGRSVVVTRRRTPPPPGRGPQARRSDEGNATCECAKQRIDSEQSEHGEDGDSRDQREERQHGEGPPLERLIEGLPPPSDRPLRSVLVHIQVCRAVERGRLPVSVRDGTAAHRPCYRRLAQLPAARRSRTRSGGAGAALCGHQQSPRPSALGWRPHVHTGPSGSPRAGILCE
jgi:hypothetical protein